MSGSVYVAMGPNCWGLHAEKKVAISMMKKRWPVPMPKSGKFEVWCCPPGSAVTPDGSIAWPKGAKDPFVVSRGEVAGGHWHG